MPVPVKKGWSWLAKNSTFSSIRRFVKMIRRIRLVISDKVSEAIRKFVSLIEQWKSNGSARYVEFSIRVKNYFIANGMLGKKARATRQLREFLRLRNVPVRTKITIPYVFLALVLAVAVSYVVTQIVYDSIEERFNNSLVEAGLISAESIVNFESRLLETERLIANIQGISGSIQQNDSSQLMDLTFPVAMNYGVEAVEILNSDGRNIFSIHHDLNNPIEDYTFSQGAVDFRDWEFVQAIFDQKADNIGDKFAGLGRFEGIDYFYVSGPIYDENDNLIGVVLVGNSLVNLTETLRENTLGQITIYDYEGKVISSTLGVPPERLESLGNTILENQINDASSRNYSSGGINYREILGPFEARHDQDFGILGTSLPLNLFVTSSLITRTQVAGLAIIAIVLVVFTGLSLANRITNPLKKLVSATSKVAVGELNTLLSPTGNDEIGLLAKSFNSMTRSLSRSNFEKEEAYEKSLIGWAHALELRDHETQGHSERVANKTIELAALLDISGDQLRYIYWGALLHDIGKMAIPDRVLLKKGKLSTAQRKIIEKHPELALEMLEQISFLDKSLAIPYSHHEKWDGTGYPRGLKGLEIPLEARIFAVVDVWDALLSDRPYRPAWPLEKTRSYIYDNRGSHFDPDIADLFLSQQASTLAISKLQAESLAPVLMRSS